MSSGIYVSRIEEMPHPQNTIRTKKDSGNAGDNTPGRKKPAAAKEPNRQKKRAGSGGAGGGGGNHDDDDSVDSRGNLRGFIARTDE